MTRNIKCFISDGHLATPDSCTVTPVFELTGMGKTFSKRKLFIPLTEDQQRMLTVFDYKDSVPVTKTDALIISDVATKLCAITTRVFTEDKVAIIAEFTAEYNSHGGDKISDVNYNSLVDYNGKKYPDYFTFKLKDMHCNVWLAIESFKLFYPLYETEMVVPFDNFVNIVNNPNEMLKMLSVNRTDELTDRMVDVRGPHLATTIRTPNIRYRASWESREIDCFWGFNIYGPAGDYDYIWKDIIYDYFKDLGYEDIWIEEHWPDLFRVNEFFVIPSWEEYAIVFKDPQGSINSQINLAFNEPFNIMKYVTPYEGSDKHVRENTYNVPSIFNNLMLRIINGKFTRGNVVDFKELYGDMITVPTTHADFDRQKPETMRLVEILSYLLNVGDSSDSTELANKIMANQPYTIGNDKYRISLAVRNKTTYITTHYNGHRYYVIPRYVHENITKGIVTEFRQP